MSEDKFDVCESSLVKFAKRELNLLLSQVPNNEMQQEINKDILEIIKIFAQQGHSGFSASYAINLLVRLLDYKPLSPLTGSDDEWIKLNGYSDENIETYQNKRCGAVFKKVNKQTKEIKYRYNDKYIISDNGGITWFMGLYVLEKLGLTDEITMPFTVPSKPKHIYIKYLEDVPLGETSDNFIDITNDEEEIKKLREIYEKKFEKEKSN